jgi:hypothetical protein
MNNEKLEAGLASDLNRELDTLVAGTLQAANEYLAGMLLPHQQRVVDEKTELDDKLGKLNAFILTSPHFAQLQNEEKERLQRQFSIMRDYTSVLGERIDAFA